MEAPSATRGTGGRGEDRASRERAGGQARGERQSTNARRVRRSAAARLLVRVVRVCSDVSVLGVGACCVRARWSSATSSMPPATASPARPRSFPPVKYPAVYAPRGGHVEDDHGYRGRSGVLDTRHRRCRVGTENRQACDVATAEARQPSRASIQQADASRSLRRPSVAVVCPLSSFSCVCCHAPRRLGCWCTIDVLSASACLQREHRCR